ncbi:MAG: excinuclease ABC subunit UvrC [Treponema sp.]|nr:excinuclease ABC subunit UvrC [Treponema sp.]
MDNQENIIDILKASARDAPSEPGVYIMKNAESRIIYVGKAKNLKNRLKTYFSALKFSPSGTLEGTGDKDKKTVALVKRIHSFETIIVPSEYDALLLENTLIKQHSPKYNISLKDGKTYPLIRITSESFPRIYRTRRVIQDNSLYFGPFPDGQAVTAIIDLIDKLFPLRKCRKMRKNSPCMYYHIKRCMAPCCGKIGKDEYALHIEHVQKLLSGDSDSLIIDLTEKMHEAARALKFEDAAQIRNTIRAIENLSGEDSSVEDLNPENRDYIAWAFEGFLYTFTVFSMRGGKMTGRDLYRTFSAADEQDSLELFITNYYDSAKPPPAKIFFQNFTQRHEDTENMEDNEGEGEKNLNSSSVDSAPQRLCESSLEIFSKWFKEQFDYVPEILAANEKHHNAIMAMAGQNASEDLRKRLKERGAGPALDELARVLNMETRPHRIEGFDISHLDGKYPTASLISFKNGVPDRKNYRHYKLRTVIGKADDYAGVREVVRRRYSALLRDQKELPDLILIDGGIGQVNAAKAILDELGIDCTLASLAEREEEIWLPKAKKPLILERRSDALKVLQHVRDECHRFAVNFNKKLRSKDLFFSVLESVEGIGPKRALIIMKEYESTANIAAADIKDIAERCRISEEAARAVRAVIRLEIDNHKKTVNN